MRALQKRAALPSYNVEIFSVSFLFSIYVNYCLKIVAKNLRAKKVERAQRVLVSYIIVTKIMEYFKQSKSHFWNINIRASKQK